MTLEFVEGWAIIQTLGEGAYGEVKLLANKLNGDLVAMKIIDVGKHPQAKECVKKEVLIHRMLKNDRVLSFLGFRQHNDFCYLFLEYAPHGELFDKIEPDIGMNVSDTRKYILQLSCGVEYLHSQGVAHRDLKPENLLLDVKDDLKISDFGLATIFKAKGKERLLNKKCGTLPYVAPEVLSRAYAAEPADVWSCGIILVAMLAGELPWDKADENDCKEYKLWKSGSYMGISPWSKIDNLALSLIRRILAPLPSARLKLNDVKVHKWTNLKSRKRKTMDEVDGVTNDCMVGHKEGRQMLLEGKVDFYVHSQPAGRPSSDLQSKEAFLDHHLAFSQPTDPCQMLLPSQGVVLTQPNSNSQQPLWKKLVKRMTRFFVSLSCEAAFTELTLILEKYSLDWKTNNPGCVTIETIDKRKNKLVFKANIAEMEEDQTLLDFRLSKGCGLEFKKLFVSIKLSFSDFITSSPLWPSLV